MSWRICQRRWLFWTLTRRINFCEQGNDGHHTESKGRTFSFVVVCPCLTFNVELSIAPIDGHSCPCFQGRNKSNDVPRGELIPHFQNKMADLLSKEEMVSTRNLEKTLHRYWQRTSKKTWNEEYWCVLHYSNSNDIIRIRIFRKTWVWTMSKF